ncbi:MAG: hypothetical protein V3S83_10110 [Gemmatimonadota bacterium]
MAGLKRLIQEVHRRSLWQVLAIYLVGAAVGYQLISSRPAHPTQHTTEP